MRSQQQTPVWPFLIVLACLFVLSVTAPRAWQAKVRQAAKPAASEDARIAKRATAPPPVAKLDLPRREESSPRASEPPSARLAMRPVSPPIRLPRVVDLVPPFASQGVVESPYPSTDVETDDAIVPELAIRPEPPASAPDMAPVKDKPATVTPEPSHDRAIAATLIAQLDSLNDQPNCMAWAQTVRNLLLELESRYQKGDDSASAVAERLQQASRDGARLASTLTDSREAAILVRVQYALVRRLDIWNAVPGLGVGAGGPSAMASGASAKPKLLPRSSMAVCLSEIETLTSKQPQGAAWREYLLISELRGAMDANHDSAAHKKQLADRVLARLSTARQSTPQRQFLQAGPLATLSEELRRWSVRKVDARTVLEDVERYEATPGTASARQLAADWRSLNWSPESEDKQLAAKLESHYRNANVRIAVAGSLINRFVPQPAATSAPVNDIIVGAEVHGHSTTFTRLLVRLLPDPRQIRLGFEASGVVDSSTAATSGPATLYTAGQSSFLVRKLAVIDAQGFRTKPAVSDAETYYQDLVSVETSYDRLPIIGPMARNMARSQHEESRGQAQMEVEDRLESRAREEFEARVEPRLKKARQDFDRKVVSPLARLSLDLTPIDLSTTSERVIARLRVSGEDQIGAHTPRPKALSDSLLSLQLHDSALNNAIQRLDLAGRKFTIAELTLWVTEKLGMPPVNLPEDLPDDVSITFADEDAVRLHCDGGRMEVCLAVAELTQRRNHWRNFIVRAYYKPEIASPQARLVRDGGIELDGPSIKGKPELMLRGIFSKALSKNRPWNLLNEKLAGDRRLRDLEVSQFTLEDGWIGLSYAARRAPSDVAKRKAVAR